MDFSYIALKMFKAEIKKYKVFIFCNLLEIAILYGFISIVLNSEFMNSNIVDPMISSNIYAPTFMVMIFTAIFIPYAQNVFIKSRQKDYGILLTIGMSENETIKWILIENCILCAISLVGGLILGTLLSIFFLVFIHYEIGII